jgi:5-formyltetrahydrofolate cyclo-ligase
MQEDAYNIPKPKDTEVVVPTLLFVPCVGYGPGGYRLGYGGGWYDRLRADPLWRAVPSVVVLPSGCLKPALPRDPWDVPFDAWLDETGLHPCTDQA